MGNVIIHHYDDILIRDAISVQYLVRVTDVSLEAVQRTRQGKFEVIQACLIQALTMSVLEKWSFIL